jgi:hypothetical protein
MRAVYTLSLVRMNCPFLCPAELSLVGILKKKFPARRDIPTLNTGPIRCREKRSARGFQEYIHTTAGRLQTFAILSEKKVKLLSLCSRPNLTTLSFIIVGGLADGNQRSTLYLQRP